MRSLFRGLFAALFGLALVSVASAEDKPTPRPAAKPIAQPGEVAKKVAQEKGTHKQEKFIPVASADGKLKLQTLTVDGDGRVLGLVAPPRYFSATASSATSEVHVFSPEGKKLHTWKVPFHAHAINTANDGTVYVAGEGKVAKFDKAGKSLAQVELPHIKKLLENKEELTKQAKEELEQQKKSFAESIKRFEEMKAKLEAVPEEKRTALQKRQLTQYVSILKSYEQTKKFYDSRKVEDVVAQLLARLRIINSVAVSSKDIFIVCGESKGYGYAVWRMSHDFKDAKPVMTAQRGCCGQFDVQVHGDDLLVAQNCAHQWARYDRDGKVKGSFGKRGAETDPECFGGCCNPMNVRANAKGEVYTAESEGIIKRYSEKGDFLGVVGHAPLTGGCKNVGVGASPDGSRVYFCDQPGSRIIVLAKK